MATKPQRRPSAGQNDPPLLPVNQGVATLAHSFAKARGLPSMSALVSAIQRGPKSGVTRLLMKGGLPK